MVHLDGAPQHLAGIFGLLVRCKDLTKDSPDGRDPLGAGPASPKARDLLRDGTEGVANSPNG